MNERIKQLALECYNPYSNFDHEKFSELIVRDCALTAGLMEHEGRNGIGAQLLDNFGIEP
jgi:hypothetical protein